MSREIKLVQGDINISNGRIQTLENEDKLQQQTLKIVVSTKGGKYNPEYGSEIYDLIGKYALNDDALLPLMRSTIEEAMAFYIKIQDNQELFQDMTDEEVLLRLEELDVQKISETDFSISGTLINRAGQNVNLNII